MKKIAIVLALLMALLMASGCKSQDQIDAQQQVVAAADGIVEQVYTCELMGLTVEIRHADDTISVYQSLSGEAEVIAGQEVRQGDVIGKTGSSADCEVLEGDHLHFALIRDGVYLNPQERFS